MKQIYSHFVFLYFSTAHLACPWYKKGGGSTEKLYRKFTNITFDSIFPMVGIFDATFDARFYSPGV